MPKRRRIFAVSGWSRTYKLLGSFAAAIALVLCGGLFALTNNSSDDQSDVAKQAADTTAYGDNEVALGTVNGATVTNSDIGDESKPPEQSTASPAPSPASPNPSPSPAPPLPSPSPTPPPPPPTTSFSVHASAGPTIHIDAGSSASVIFSASDGRNASWSGGPSSAGSISAAPSSESGPSYTVSFSVGEDATSGESLTFTVTADDKGVMASESITLVVN